jgi:hypothetical protein
MQSQEFVLIKLYGLLSTNQNRSLSGVFKALRKDARISAIADYPVLSFILRTAHSRAPQYNWTKPQIMHAIRISGFCLESGEHKKSFLPSEWNQYVKQAK